MDGVGKVVQRTDLNELDQQAVSGALEARDKAYCPYSKFNVGAALVSGSGKIYKGCNVENAAYPLCICAEKTAIVKAISEGETSITSIAVVANKVGYCAPCGGCRQFIYEFGQETNCKVFLVRSPPNGECVETTIKELLPAGFGPADLDINSSNQS